MATEQTPGDRFTTASADRPPTRDEAEAAERGKDGVDVDEVGEHFEEMNEIGANVKGEGEITPER